MLDKRAFSLLEQSLVIAILSLMMATGSLYFKNSDYKYKYDETNRRVKILNNAIISYYLKNSASATISDGEFPCPADPALNQSDTSFGLDSSTGSTCNLSYSNNNYFYGSIPIRDLGLPYFYAYDAWGHRFSYVVKYSNVPDILTDWSENSKTEMLYAIISHGENGYSAYNKYGAKRQVSSDSNELNNSIDSTDYSLVADYNKTSSYDDLVYSITGARFLSELAGGVIPNSILCNVLNNKTYTDNSCVILQNKILTMCPEQ